MANKNNTTALPTSGGDGYGLGCAAVAACVGQQVFDPQRNLCGPPPCGSYFFHELDPHDPATCRVRPVVKVRRIVLFIH